MARRGLSLWLRSEECLEQQHPPYVRTASLQQNRPNALMRIACLGWGSLIWKPGILPLEAGWRRDGPDLPIDFARESDGGELATVICSTAPMTRVMWTIVRTSSITAAREFLRLREQIPSSRPESVGCVFKGTFDPQIPFAEKIDFWAKGQRLDGVVWTALPPRFQGENGRAPSIEEALRYLQDLPIRQRNHAESYVRTTPRFVATALREAICDELGWTPNSKAAELLRYRQGAPCPRTSRRRRVK